MLENSRRFELFNYLSLFTQTTERCFSARFSLKVVQCTLAVQNTCLSFQLQKIVKYSSLQIVPAYVTVKMQKVKSFVRTLIVHILSVAGLFRWKKRKNPNVSKCICMHTVFNAFSSEAGNFPSFSSLLSFIHS